MSAYWSRFFICFCFFACFFRALALRRPGELEHKPLVCIRTNR